MALFVFGAGATRGAEFYQLQQDGEKQTEKSNPCLPPVDQDFFTQLQKVRNPKHQKLITDVMQDVVRLFGPNFNVTMEAVFTTLEHAIKMLGITGKESNFTIKDLKEMSQRLQQAIAVVMEESLMKQDVATGASTLEMRPCNNHDRFVQTILQQNDQIISFNYDCVLDNTLKEKGDSKWNARYGYGFNLGAKGLLLSGDDYWNPKDPASKSDTIKLYKLHGSLHFDVKKLKPTSIHKKDADKFKVQLKQRVYTKQNGNLRFTIMPPQWHKSYDIGVFKALWKHAANAIYDAEHVVLIGYSLPLTDLHSTVLFRTHVHKKKLKSIVVVNPDKEARRRTRYVFQNGLTPETRVLSFDTFGDFIQADRSIWEIR